MAKTMHNALAEAGLNGDDIDYVNAHATGTVLGDIAEAVAIHSIFGKDVPVSSYKGHLGHTLGADKTIAKPFNLEEVLTAVKELLD